VIDVGNPHVEGRDADLEGEAGDDEHQAEHQEGAVGGGAGELRRDVRDLGDVERSGRAVDHRHAVQQQPGGQRAEHEVLHRRLGRERRVAVERHQRVQAERHQLQAEIDGEEARGADHDHHAEQREQQQGDELAAQQAAVEQVLARVDQSRPDRRVADELEQVRQRVGNEQPVEEVELRRAVDPLHEQRRRAGRRQHAQREAEAGDAPLALHVQVDQHQHAGAEQDDDLGQRRDVVDDVAGVHRLSTATCLSRSLTEVCITSVKATG